YCLQHKIVAGSFDTLKKYGTHSETPETSDDQPYVALVYIDSPFLLGCELIDLPGYGHSDTDHDKAEFGQSLADIIIYASTATGFMNASDIQYVGGLLRTLKPIETREPGLPALRNFYCVAT